MKLMKFNLIQLITHRIAHLFIYKHRANACLQDFLRALKKCLA